MGRSKHIARRSRFLQEAQARRRLRCRHIAGDVQAADLLTKPLDRKRFVALRRYLMNVDAMVEAPVEGRAAKHEDGETRAKPGDDYESSGAASRGGETHSTGVDDRHLNGTDHGGVSTPECLRDGPSTGGIPGLGSNR
mgnify:CR=1 FL=1